MAGGNYGKTPYKQPQARGAKGRTAFANDAYALREMQLRENARYGGGSARMDAIFSGKNFAGKSSRQVYMEGIYSSKKPRPIGPYQTAKLTPSPGRR